TPSIPAAQRLLDPGQVELSLDGAHEAGGLLEVPRLVGVEHEGGLLGIGPQRLVEDAQPAHVVGDAPPALELARDETALGHARIEGRELLVAQSDVEPGGVPLDVPLACSEQTPERFSGELGLEVPESRV